MAKSQSRKSAATSASPGDRVGDLGASREQMSAAGLLSFLKQTRRFQTWTEKDFAKTLDIGLPQAKDAIAVLQLQGYVAPAGSPGEWRVTEQGDLVSGARVPRFTRQTVEDALAALRDRIQSVNEDANAPYRITEAAAFGDFLSDAVRVQAADVGIRLVPRTREQSIASLKARSAERNFLKQLRGKTGLLHVIPYEEWMSSRSHIRLL